MVRQNGSPSSSPHSRGEITSAPFERLSGLLSLEFMEAALAAMEFDQAERIEHIINIVRDPDPKLSVQGLRELRATTNDLLRLNGAVAQSQQTIVEKGEDGTSEIRRVQVSHVHRLIGTSPYGSGDPHATVHKQLPPRAYEQHFEAAVGGPSGAVEGGAGGDLAGAEGGPSHTGQGDESVAVHDGHPGSRNGTGRRTAGGEEDESGAVRRGDEPVEGAGAVGDGQSGPDVAGRQECGDAGVGPVPGGIRDDASGESGAC